MCDSARTAPGTGWRGWNTSDTSRPARAAGDWIDLTWPLSPTVPRISSFPPPRIERIASIPEEPLNITELSMIVYIGTHVDSPRHFFSDGPALEDVPLARLMGPGVVWRIDKPLDGMIEPEDFERMRPRLEPGDILLLDTGVAEYVGTPDYDRHAALSVAAAEWLVDRKIKLLAVDIPTPDIPITGGLKGSTGPFTMRCCGTVSSARSRLQTPAHLRDAVLSSCFCRSTSSVAMAHRRACSGAPSASEFG